MALRNPSSCWPSLRPRQLHPLLALILPPVLRLRLQRDLWLPILGLRRPMLLRMLMRLHVRLGLRWLLGGFQCEDGEGCAEKR